MIDDMLCNAIGCIVMDYLRCMDTDFGLIVQEESIKMLNEIRVILVKNDLSDFMKVDMIVSVFEGYGVDAGECHDF